MVHFGHQQVFEGANTYTCLLFLSRVSQEIFQFAKVNDIRAWRQAGESINGIISSSTVTQAEWNITVGASSALYERLTSMPVKLGDLADIFVGLQTSADTVFLFKDTQRSDESLTVVASKELGVSVDIETTLLKSVIRSGNIGRYWAHPTAIVLFPYIFVNGRCQLYPERAMEQTYPKGWAYLKQNQKLLAEREHGKFKASGWHQLYPKNLDLWEQPKIMIPYMVTRLAAYYDEDNHYFVNVTTGGFGLTIKQTCITPKYLTGLLNSRLLDWFIRQVSMDFRGGYFAANKQFLVQLPIHIINLADPIDKTHQDQIVTLVERMLDLHKCLPTVRTPQEKTLLQRQIDATDRQIDQLVYALYELTPKEIKVVEEATR